MLPKLWARASDRKPSSRLMTLPVVRPMLLPPPPPLPPVIKLGPVVPSMTLRPILICLIVTRIIVFRMTHVISTLILILHLGPRPPKAVYSKGRVFLTCLSVLGD